MKTKRFLAMVLSVMMILSLLPTNFVFAADGDVTYLYCDENGANWQTGTKAAGEYTLVTSSNTAWGTSGSETWYYASGNITISNRVTVSGDVHLILADGCNLTVNGGIAVNSGNKFTIYAQNDGTGILTSSSNTSGAGIGSNGDKTGGDITINGGFINASAPAYYGDPAGIGGGSYAVCGIVTVNRGTVNASGCGKGIGCGAGKTGGKIIFNGGFITAGGIGSGSYGESVETYVKEKAVVINRSDKLNTSKESEWQGIVFNGNNGKIYGTTATPNEDFEIPNSKTLTIASGQTLTVPEGVTLTNNSTIVIEEGGQLIVEGTLINNSEITNNGTLGGAGDVKNKVAISFNAGEGSGTMESVTAYTTDTYTLPDCDFTAPAAKQFKGWATASDGAVISETTITVNEDTTLYAVWENIPATAPTISSVSADFTDDNALAYGEITAEDKLTVTAEADSNTEYNALEYQWYKAASASSKDGAEEIEEATEASYAIPTNTTAGDYYYYCTVTATRKDNGEKATADTRIISVTILPQTINTEIPLTAPAPNEAPQTTIDTDEYTATVVWSPEVTDKFAYSTAYTATITITPKANYTVTGISENSYTANGAETVVNEADSGVVTITYAETGRRPSSGGGTTRYTVKFETNGGSSVTNKTVTRNSTLAEPIAPTKDGYTFDGWYTDKELTKAYDFDTKVTKGFTLYAKWVVVDGVLDVPSEFKNPFADVKTDDWFYEDVKYAAENGLFNGTTETTFAPNGIITRAMMVTVLYRAEGEPQIAAGDGVGNDLRVVLFNDIAPNAYYANAVTWAKQNNIVKGISETEFAPNDNITREQIAAIMHRYAQYKGYDVSVGENTNILSYDDFTDISEYAIAPMQYAVGSGLMKGKTASSLNPLDNATRAEIATILHRFIEENR